MTLSAQEDPQEYHPTTTQLEREIALRRFNWLVLYIPIGLAGLAVLVLIGLMIWGTLSPHITGTREFASGMADLIVILTIVPLMLLCAIFPAAVLGYVVYRRQQPKREHGRFRTLFWRLETLLEKTSTRTETILPKAANPIIAGHAWATFWRTLIDQFKYYFTRR